MQTRGWHTPDTPLSRLIALKFLNSILEDRYRLLAVRGLKKSSNGGVNFLITDFQFVFKVFNWFKERNIKTVIGKLDQFGIEIILACIIIVA